mmetsp:Transcript_9571/g.19582  ORF Transcript_9571/g.19582 Transcript_9571/m.19582 type:complete len:318 (+) Transcript_9571:786-1739(+)
MRLTTQQERAGRVAILLPLPKGGMNTRDIAEPIGPPEVVNNRLNVRPNRGSTPRVIATKADNDPPTTARRTDASNPLATSSILGELVSSVALESIIRTKPSSHEARSATRKINGFILDEEHSIKNTPSIKGSVNMAMTSNGLAMSVFETDRYPSKAMSVREDESNDALERMEMTSTYVWLHIAQEIGPKGRGEAAAITNPVIRDSSSDRIRPITIADNGINIVRATRTANTVNLTRATRLTAICPILIPDSINHRQNVESEGHCGARFGFADTNASTGTVNARETTPRVRSAAGLGQTRSSRFNSLYESSLKRLSIE